jgi:hypothetical protein
MQKYIIATANRQGGRFETGACVRNVIYSCVVEAGVLRCYTKNMLKIYKVRVEVPRAVSKARIAKELGMINLIQSIEEMVSVFQGKHIYVIPEDQEWCTIVEKKCIETELRQPTLKNMTTVACTHQVEEILKGRNLMENCYTASVPDGEMEPRPERILTKDLLWIAWEAETG